MLRLMTAIAFLTASIGFSSTAAAQALTFAKADYRSDIGARAIVAADFNRDGWLDVAHANIDRNTVTILLNHGGSGLVRAFEVPVGAGPFDLTTGDFNRDGIPDLAVANADGHSISILLGRGDGSFARADIAAASQNPRGITTADVNNDGRPDVIYTGYATGTVQVLINRGAGRFSEGPSNTAAGTQPQGVGIGDFNHDGLPDIAVACNSASGLRILYGSSAGTFTARTIPGHANLNVVAVGDLDGDGWLDVAAASAAGSDVAVYLGGPAGLAFAHSYIVGASPRGIALGDVNGDGRLDVITANRSSSTVSVLAGDRAHPGAFLAHEEFAAARGSRALVTGDFDGDGRLDVATGSQYAGAVTVLSNDTVFERAAFTFGALTVPSDRPLGAEDNLSDSRFSPTPQIAVADFNRDGKLDFVVPGAPISGPSEVIVMLRDGPSVSLPGPTPLTGFIVDDFNADGNPDVLYYSSDPSGTDQVTRFLTYLGDGHGHFTAAPMTIDPHSLAFCVSGDMVRDRRPDLVCDNRILLANGDGTFRSGVAYASESDGLSQFPGPLVADVNRDGILDVVAGAGVYLGNGFGRMVFADSFGSGSFGAVAAIVDLNRDGYLDFVIRYPPDGILISFGSADGSGRCGIDAFAPCAFYPILEDSGGIAIADVNADGHPDIVINGSASIESAGSVMILFGSADGTFTPTVFTLTPGRIVVADVTGDGLPDIVAFDAHAVHVLVNQRNDTNHPPIVSDYSLTSGNPCVTLDARASDPDQQPLAIDWFDSSGVSLGTSFGARGLDVCVDHPATYSYRRTARDDFGGSATGTVTFTYIVTMKEIVLYAAADNVAMTGNWSRVADATAAGGFRAHDANLGAPKVTQPSETPANSITIPFLADPNLTYKLWIRLKADADSWANDSVWVQLSGSSYQPGNSLALSVSLEECVTCGVSGWGWEDDGFGAVNKNGTLLRFEPGPQTIVIQTREDGVSIDQVVLSADRYLTTRPGTAKGDHTILPATTVR
jgi:FG-GAP-like repeat